MKGGCRVSARALVKGMHMQEPPFMQRSKKPVIILVKVEFNSTDSHQFENHCCTCSHSGMHANPGIDEGGGGGGGGGTVCVYIIIGGRGLGACYRNFGDFCGLRACLSALLNFVNTVF